MRPTRPRSALAGLVALAVGAVLPLLPSPAVGAPLPSMALASTALPAQVMAGSELGYDRIGVRRGNTWYLRDALDGGPNRSYREGLPGYVPVAGDTDGDGNGTVSLFKDGLWLISDGAQTVPRIVRFGLPGDVPVLGDWDGDGTDTIGVFRRGRWYLRNANASGPSTPFGFGVPGDRPVVGDWNGDGRTDIGVTRGSRWFQRDATSSGPSSRTFLFGNPGDLPVAGDWDHDGKDTPGLYRGGTWFFRQGSFPSPYQTTRFGLPGDKPVVRRTPGLAPGVSHAVVRLPGPVVAQVARVQLSAASSPDAVLSGGELAGTEAVSRMTRRAGAVLGVNGDYFLGSGRPVHVFAEDGRLVQTPTTLGRAFSLDVTGTRFSMGYPDVRSALVSGATSVDLPRANLGAPAGASGVAYTVAGRSLLTPPAGFCYAGLSSGRDRTVRPDGRVDTTVTVTGTRCGEPRPLVPSTGTMTAFDPRGAGGNFVRALRKGGTVTLRQQLGFPGAVDTIGGNPLLVSGGAVLESEVTGSGAFFARAPRTAVGVTRDGTLLVVVVDGRVPSYSRGMTLRELAQLMQSLGAQEALNLDGGGSSTMALNGLVANRPSDGFERPVSNALVVLPGLDPGQTDLLPGQVIAPLPPAAPTGRGPSSVPSAEQTDPASTGGLADALLRQGQPVTGELRRTAEVFRQSR